MIEPTVGRVVHYYDSKSGGPLAAHVAYVHTNRLVNLLVISPHGNTYGAQRVRLLQDDDKPEGEATWCQWMDYQKGQAAKTEALEKQLVSK